MHPVARAALEVSRRIAIKTHARTRCGGPRW
jgi:hypothetical protein